MESVYKYDGVSKTDCFFYYSGDHVGKISAGSVGKESLLFVTAKTNMALTVSTAAFNTPANNLIVRSIVSDGTNTEILSETLGGSTGTAIAANALGGTYHLKSGDSFCFVIGSTNEYTCVRNAIAPVFAVDTGSYSSDVRDGYYIDAVSANEIAKYVAENEAYENGYQTTEADYFLRYGSVQSVGEMTAFTQRNEESVYKYDGTEKIDCFFYYAGSNAGKISAGRAGYESAIVVKAKADAAITVYNAAFETTANNLVVSTVLFNGSKSYTAKTVAGGAKNAPIAANALGGTYHLKSGDSLYFVVGSTNEYTIRLNQIEPKFALDTAGYVATEREKYYPTVKEDNEVTSVEIAQYVHDYLAYEDGYETTNASYSLRWGDSENLSELNRFEKTNQTSVYEYNGTLKIDCFFYYLTDESYEAGMISAGLKGYETVIKVVAKSNFALTVGNKMFTTPANNLLVKLYATNGTTLVKLEEYTGYATGTEIMENQFGGTYHLKVGDTFYYVIGSTNEYPIRKLNIDPSFKVDEAGYSDDARTEIYAVQESIPVKVAELRTYFEGLDQTLYTAANVLKMEGYVEEFAEEAALVKTLDELGALYNEYKQKIDDVLTIAEAASELTAYKESKIAELQEMYDTYLKENSYDAEGKKALKEAFDSAKTNIEKATSKNMVNTALAAAKKAMDKVETKKSGCGGYLGASGAIAGAVALIGVALSKNKRKENGK
ncbi:MAG: hypothetical protein IJY62_00235 [Clostridia bacterium]|nr:hypothetical protein [Clostridia bacterium]